MKKLEFIFSTIIGTIFLWLLIFGTIDIYSFRQDKETYARVHHLEMDKKGLEWDYLRGNILAISIGIVGLGIVLSRIAKPENKIIGRLNAWLIGLSLLALLYGLVRAIPNFI